MTNETRGQGSADRTATGAPARGGVRWGKRAHMMSLAAGATVAVAVIFGQLALFDRLENQIRDSSESRQSAIVKAVSISARQVWSLSIVATVALCLAGYGAACLLKAHALSQERRRNGLDRERLERALFEAQALAAESNLAKARFVDSLSQAAHGHLNEIVSMADMVMDAPLSDHQVEWLQSVRDSADSLVKLLNDSMDLSIIEVTRPELETIDFSLRCCLGDSLEALKLRAKAKGLDMESVVALDVPDALQGDPGRLRQVLGNLVGNAIKFSDQGRISFRAALESRGGDNLQLHFTVSDTGAGIDRDRRALIAKLLEDPTPVAFRRSGVTGLGLLISARLVKMMGGRIWLADKPGQGCEFHFTAGAKVQGPSVWVATDKAVNLRGMTVLAVSSESSHRARLKQTLEQWQMQPVFAETWQTAMATFKKAQDAGDPITLAILDACVSETDGFDLAERLIKASGDNRLAMIMLTSAGRRGDAKRCRQLGIAAYLTRPLAPSYLMTAVRIAVGGIGQGSRPLLTRHSLRELERRLRILLAEDNQANQRTISALVETWGHTIVMVTDGREALLAMERQPFDLVLMDSQMPEMDGPSAIAEIRRKESDRPRVPIYALVRRLDSSDIQKCLDAGADACLSKPIVQDAVFEVLEKARTAKNLREVHGHVVDLDAAGPGAPQARCAGGNVLASTPPA